MGGVFLNYRTGDGDWAAALVKRELSVRFGADNVFYAGQSIRLGEDFSRRILGRLRECEVLLALIGPRWLSAEDRHGGRRLDKPDDWVRREIGEAFRVGLRVIPVLLDGIDRLDETHLPEDIAQLARCQYLRMHHRSDDFDLTRLVDELIELVPELVTTRAELPPPMPSRSTNGTGPELRSLTTRLRQALSDPGAVTDVVQAAASQTVDALDYPPATRHVDNNDIPAELEKRLSSYEQDMAPLLRLVAIGVCSGDRQHDGLWLTIRDRFLRRRDKPAAYAEQDFHTAAERYPPLLLTYVIGVAGMCARREDLVYRLLTHTTTRPDGRQLPVLRALALRHVVDPRLAAALPKWFGVAPHQAFSVHVRDVLRPAFFNVVDDREYESSFADYECLRSLLELHDGAFSSLGEFAVAFDKGDTTVYRRLTARLGADSVLLRSGAFDGDTDRVTTAWSALRQSIHGRYV